MNDIKPKVISMFPFCKDMFFSKELQNTINIMDISNPQIFEYNVEYFLKSINDNIQTADFILVPFGPFYRKIMSDNNIDFDIVMPDINHVDIWIGHVYSQIVPQQNNILAVTPCDKFEIIDTALKEFYFEVNTGIKILAECTHDIHNNIYAGNKVYYCKDNIQEINNNDAIKNIIKGLKIILDDSIDIYNNKYKKDAIYDGIKFVSTSLDVVLNMMAIANKKYV